MDCLHTFSLDNYGACYVMQDLSINHDLLCWALRDQKEINHFVLLSPAR